MIFVRGAQSSLLLGAVNNEFLFVSYGSDALTPDWSAYRNLPYHPSHTPLYIPFAFHHNPFALPTQPCNACPKV
jgi:hypothetical protein